MGGVGGSVICSARNHLLQLRIGKDPPRKPGNSSFTASTLRGRANRKSLPESANPFGRSSRYCSGVSIPFGHHVHPHHPRQFDDGAHNLQRLVALRHPPHKRPVDLEHVKGKRMQVIQ